MLGGISGFGFLAVTMLPDALFSGWRARLDATQVGHRATSPILISGIYGGIAS